MLFKFIDYMLSLLRCNLFVGGGGTSPYQINNSLRIRSSASAYLSRTMSGSSTSTTARTVSMWVKRGLLNSSGRQVLYYEGNGAATGNLLDCEFNNDTLRILADGSATATASTAAVYRDISAFYHIVFIYDSANATAGDRLRIYVNGVRLATTGTNPSLNQALTTGSGNLQQIGRVNTLNFDGVVSEIYVIDGQALDPTYFGQVDNITGAWTPKAYGGTYGANGAYLKFNDGSSLTNLGLDRSGNSNNFTLNNISLTAGVTYDWFTDTPTNNYPVYNALDKLPSVTLSGANLDYTQSTTSHLMSTTTMFSSSGKWYAEFTITAVGSTYPYVGVAKSSVRSAVNFLGSQVDGWAYNANGQKVNNNVASAYGATFTTGDVIGVALDIDNGNLAFYKNNVLQGQAFTGLSGEFGFAMSGIGATPPNISFNGGQRPFIYTPPSGYLPLNTQNILTSSIKKPSTHFDILLHNGTGASNTLTGLLFQPDFHWCKRRNAISQHVLTDVVRGVSKQIFSTLTNSEQSDATNFVLSFNSNGLTLGLSGGAVGDVNSSGGTYVDWLWKAGGSAVTNNSGSISSQVSANVSAGFSIVAYTGTGANATVGHGLGVAPKLVIVKGRTTGAQNWMVWHTSFLGTEYIPLNGTVAKAVSAAVWNSTTPTSSVISLGNSPATNNSATDTYVAYCFAEIPGFSKIGSYTGNGSADGPFVWCGFTPKFIMVKRTDSTGNWVTEDIIRNTFNPVDAALYPNLTDAEGTGVRFCDFLSNGFKLRETNTDRNASGGTYIFIAFAEVPFKYATAQ